MPAEVLVTVSFVCHWGGKALTYFLGQSVAGNAMSVDGHPEGGKDAGEKRGAYHMERWLNETGKEEAWSVYARFQ